MTTSKRDPERLWWKEAVIYQVYVRSFKDSNGDGIGDLRGLIAGLDHIAGLGVDVIWLNPVYASPDRDNGFDISNYKAIQPKAGTMADLEELIAAVHRHKMKIIMDMVVNHTSDEHEWFKQARSSRESPYYHFYHWWPEEKGEPPHRCGFFDPAGKGWEYNDATQAYYLHYFSPQQPDLNWENPELRRRIYEMLEWWLKKGIDGFRMDAILFISKDTSWPLISNETLKEKYGNDWGTYYAHGPHIHDYLREMHEKVLDRYKALVIAEASGISWKEALDFVDPGRKEVNLLCHFEGIMVGYLPGKFKKADPAGLDLRKFKEVYSHWSAVFNEKGWGTLYLGNHDQPRMVSRWGNDSVRYRETSTKMLFTFLLTMRATPFIYNGDEIGMTNIRFEKVEDYRDIETQHMYRKLKDCNGDAAGFLKDQQLAARDNGRTPFQWDASPSAGFTTGVPWINVNDNHVTVNLEAQEKDPASLLHYVRKLIRLRKERKTLVYGEYKLVGAEDPAVYAYLRSLEEDRFLVLLNFTADFVSFDTSVTFLAAKDCLLNNYLTEVQIRQGKIILKPYQALVFRIHNFSVPTTGANTSNK